MAYIKPGRYRHFKGNEYEVLYTAYHSETLEPMVVYRALYDEGGLWVRPASMWNEIVERDGRIFKRFEYTGTMDMVLRPEGEDDYREVENLTREAFWNVYAPGANEHFILHLLRSHTDFISELDLVAVNGSEIVGHIAYSKSRIAADDAREYAVITFGPVSVMPSWQGQGIGSRLIWHTLDLARKIGYRAVIIFGNPDYYHRFGFKSASDFGIYTENGENFDAFMALELNPGALGGISGRFNQSKAFEVSPEDVEAFDISFPPKEKIVTDTQLKR